MFCVKTNQVFLWKNIYNFVFQQKTELVFLFTRKKPNCDAYISISVDNTQECFILLP